MITFQGLIELQPSIFVDNVFKDVWLNFKENISWTLMLNFDKLVVDFFKIFLRDINQKSWILSRTASSIVTDCCM